MPVVLKVTAKPRLRKNHVACDQHHCACSTNLQRLEPANARTGAVACHACVDVMAVPRCLPARTVMSSRQSQRRAASGIMCGTTQFTHEPSSMTDQTPFLRRLDLTTLRIFIAVIEEQTLTRPAARKSIAVSAASRRLAELEQL